MPHAWEGEGGRVEVVEMDLGSIEGRESNREVKVYQWFVQGF